MRILGFISVIFIVLTAGCAVSNPRYSSVELEDAVQGSDESKPKKEENSERRKDYCSRCNNNPCMCQSDGNRLGLDAILLPFSIPALALGDDGDHVTEFPRYPYADDAAGSLLIDSDKERHKKNWTGTLQTFAIPMADHVDRYGGRLLLDSTSRIGFDTETNFWTESHTTSNDKQLWTGDANIVYRFAESERMQWRAGIGMNWLADQTRGDAGFNFTYGFDWFPVRPLTISSVVDAGTLGQELLFHNRTTAGVMLGPVEAFAGYDYFEVGSARFHGPVAGMGLRF